MKYMNDTILNLSAVVADTVSETVDMDFLYLASVQIKWTSTTAAGTIRLQCSNDALTWVNVANTDQTVNDNSGDVMINLADVAYKYLRAQVDWTSGSITTIVAVMNAKGI